MATEDFFFMWRLLCSNRDSCDILSRVQIKFGQNCIVSVVCVCVRIIFISKKKKEPQFLNQIIRMTEYEKK